MKSYRPEELFDATGRLDAGARRARARRATRRMSANPHANGGLLLRDLRLPDFRDYAVEVPTPGAVDAEATRVMGDFLRDVMKLNCDAAQLPRLRPGRDQLQPLAGRVRGHQPRLGWPRRSPTTTISRPTAA